MYKDVKTIPRENCIQIISHSGTAYKMGFISHHHLKLIAIILVTNSGFFLVFRLFCFIATNSTFQTFKVTNGADIHKHGNRS